jgi:hypothetical protein
VIKIVDGCKGDEVAAAKVCVCVCVCVRERVGKRGMCLVYLLTNVRTTRSLPQRFVRERDRERKRERERER